MNFKFTNPGLFTILMALLFYSAHLKGQSSSGLPPAQFLDQEKLPADLLSTKTMVILSGQTKGWKENAERLHQGMIRVGIDAVAYFHEEDLRTGIEVRRLYAESLKRRGVKHVALANVSSNGVKLAITPFSGDHTFYNSGSEAYQINTVDMEQCVTVLYRKVGQSRLRQRNFLMAQVPEYFSDVPLIRGNRIEQFARDLKLDKLAVVITPGLTAVEGEHALGEIEKYNQAIKEDSAALAEILQDYPFEYEIISYVEDEESLRNRGFHFILYQLHNSGSAIKHYLNYPMNPAETDYISVNLGSGKPELKTIPVDTRVYKYYVKHIYSKDVYLGKDWDADQDWTLALRSYIAGLKVATKVK